jgi:hypothetical protein
VVWTRRKIGEDLELKMSPIYIIESHVPKPVLAERVN